MKRKTIEHIREQCREEAVIKDGEVINTEWLIMRTELNFPPTTKYNIVDAVLKVVKEIEGEVKCK